MEGEADVIEALSTVGCEGKFLENSVLQEAITGGPKSENFRELVTWLTNEIHVLRGTDEKVAKDADFNEFMLEMSALLKEIGCPYTQFVAGPVSGRLQTRESRILLLDYLLTELMACKMYHKLKPEENSYVIPVFETSTARALETITKELQLGKPPENITPKALFDKISKTLDEAIKKTKPSKLSEPLFKTTKPLSDVQWKKLESLHKELDDEYNLRRQMLLTRLEVTIQSFQWSEKMRGREDEIVSRYQKKKQELDQYQIGGCDTDIAALLAARADLAIIEKTSSANVRKNTGSKIQKHVIGKVPDRGGRAYEHAPPPPEMPSWQQNRSSGPGAGRGGGGNRGGGRGGGNQQPWAQQGNNQGFNQRPQFDQRQQFDQRPQFDQRQQFDQRHQMDQRQNYDQRQQFDQRQSFDQRQQFNQRQFDNRGGDNQWSGGGGQGQGGGRVQGGWSQRGNEPKGGYNQRDNYDNYQSNNYGRQQYQGQEGYGGNNQNNYNNSNRGGGSYRGKSNYNRGGGNRR